MESGEAHAPFIHPGSRIAIAAVERELAEMAAVDEAVASGLRMRSARANGASVVYSIRLDRGEVEALERRAAPHGADRVASALGELRALLGL
jgi:hypothetical protein